MTALDRREPIAAVRHTVILVAIFIAIGLFGGAARRSGAVAHPSAGSILPLYVSVLASEWLLVFVVWKGVKGRGVRIAELVGGRWRSARDVVQDVLLAVLVWILWIEIQRLIPGEGGAGGLLPHTTMEMVLWPALALSAGFCEELVFRGYLQRQLIALTGSVAAGNALQGIVFGLGHLYEGTAAVARIICFGWLFGALAQWRGSLRPGMLAHAWSDIAGVLILK